MLAILPLTLLVAGAQASLLTLQSPRFTITSSTGSQLRSEPISLVQKPDVPLSLSQSDRLKLTFQIVEKDTGNGVQPHQTFLRFVDHNTGEEGIQPIRVTPGGKAKFELNMAKPPLSLPPTGDTPLQVSLLLGSSIHSPLSVPLFDLKIPASPPPRAHPDEASFSPLPEIHHTFRPAQRLPPKPISAFFAAVVLAPWLVLLSLWSQISPKVSHLFSPSILPFILTLGAFESLLVWYWVDLKLGQVLLYGGILAVVTIFTGKQALSSMGERRISRK